jgi:hypothetical protein
MCGTDGTTNTNTNMNGTSNGNVCPGSFALALLIEKPKPEY